MPLKEWLGRVKGVALWVLLGLVSGVWACAAVLPQGIGREVQGQPGQGDAIATPPTQRIYFSLDGRYRFEISNSNHWQTQTTTGKLYQLQPNPEELRWQKTLPQEYGPRFVLTGPEGQVLLLDEYINIASPYAVMLLSPTGQVIAQYSFDDLERVLAVKRAEIVAQAQYGWWISAEPEIDPETHQVMVATAGKTLSIDLTTGALSW